MFETQLNHYELLRKTLNGERPIDTKTLASIEILKDRLKHLKDSHSAFGEVSLSSEVRQLFRQRAKFAVV